MTPPRFVVSRSVRRMLGELALLDLRSTERMMFFADNPACVGDALIRAKQDHDEIRAQIVSKAHQIVLIGTTKIRRRREGRSS